MSETNVKLRQAGILLHPSSLPSGQLDTAAWHWVDWLADAGISVWQVLPLGIPLLGLSPYQCASAFALNPALFPAMPEALGDETAFQQWYSQQQHWVDDYVLFMLIKQLQHGASWQDWPPALRQHQPEALQHLWQQHAEALQQLIHEQYHCYRHWQELRHYASNKGIRLFGDMPIFVAYDSADVWAHPQRFLLDEQGACQYVTGVPPDYFSETGQRWGNPHYHWDYMASENFLWWKQRLGYHFDCFDLVRIDHFRGLAASWMIPASEPTAVNGFWQEVPGDAMLAEILSSMGRLPLVAEDLGMITPDVTALRDKYALPGMSVLQFGFDHFEDNPHKPHNVRNNSVYYTGTHDNDTLLGWFHSLDTGAQQHVLGVLNCESVEQLSEAMLTTILSSPAQLAIIPLQDLLKLGSEARMNVPGTVEGNWQWRFTWQDIPDSLALTLRHTLQEQQRL